jgi:hypothetical protein
MEKEFSMNREGYIAARQFPQMPDGSYVSGASVLQEVMDWVIPDGRVEFPKGEIRHAPAVDIAQLPPDQREELRLFLAKVLYTHVQDVWAAPGNTFRQQLREELEPVVALQLAPYREDPAFLTSVAEVVDAVITAKQERPSRVVYPTVY